MSSSLEETTLSGRGCHEIPSQSIDFSYDFLASANAAYDLARTGNILYDFKERLLAPITKINLGLRFKLNEQKLDSEISHLSSKIAAAPVYPSLTLIDNKIEVDKGSPGTEIDKNALRIQIGQILTFAKNDSVPIPFKNTVTPLSDEEASKYKERAEKLISKTFNLKFNDQVFPYKGKDFLTLLDPRKEYKETAISEIASQIASNLNREPQNPVFIYENEMVKEFSPATEGVKVKEDVLATIIVANLRTLEESNKNLTEADIPVIITPPKIKTEEVNNLGIKELVGKGTSLFYHSIANRIYNIKLASSKFKGILVAPGETFSFNKILGDVSDLTGYKQAYIIQEGKTILGDGGGVCQVSTTLFRAALSAGLPILERTAHAYRVGYYEQDSPPGLDATVFTPTTDLKFKNDTSGYILIQPTVNDKKYALTFEIYGTKDGRIATVSKPIVTDLVKPPDDLYQDDPTLPTGQIKQIDFRAWGSKVTYKYKVERSGEIIFQKTFISNYRPWQAIFLRGTGVAN
jgi:vancomycin resistance protein YoaR